MNLKLEGMIIIFLWYFYATHLQIAVSTIWTTNEYTKYSLKNNLFIATMQKTKLFSIVPFSQRNWSLSLTTVCVINKNNTVTALGFNCSLWCFTLCSCLQGTKCNFCTHQSVHIYDEKNVSFFYALSCSFYKKQNVQ